MKLFRFKRAPIYFAITIFVFINTLFGENVFAAEAKLCKEIFYKSPLRYDELSVFDLIWSPSGSRILRTFKDSLVEVTYPIQRNQGCFGTCFIEAGVTAAEVALKTKGLIGSEDSLSTFSNDMKIARIRYKQSGKTNLYSLLNSGTNEVAQQLKQGPTHYMNKKNLEHIGGPQAFYNLEEKLRWKWFFISTMNSDRMKKIFDLDDDAFYAEVRAIEESYFSSVTKETISLDSLTLEKAEFRIFFGRNDGREFYESNSQSAVTPAGDSFHVNSVRFMERVLPVMVEALDSGYAINIGVKFFPLGMHALVITGYIAEPLTGRVIGFKYLNSWGKLVSKVGFLSLDKLASNVRSISILDELSP